MEEEYLKFSIYNNVVEDGGILYLYNSLSEKVVSFTKKRDIEYFKKILNTKKFNKHSNMAKFLYKNNYIVDDDYDEYSVAHNKVHSFYDGTELYIFLYVTNQCNFRCVYCPQEHESKAFSDEIWDSLYKFTEKKLALKKFKKVTFSFFGGEPLLESKSIIEFLIKISKLKDKYPEVDFNHLMTTNGYLLTPEIYDKLVSLDVKRYQITVDGMADAHDVARPRADGSGTWDKIMENISYIDRKYDNVYVTLRSNLSTQNEESLTRFFEWFDKTYFNSKFVYFVYGVSKFSSKVDDRYIVDYFKQKYNGFIENVMLKHKRFFDARVTPFRLLSQACKCANPEFYTINAIGGVTKCEQAIDEFNNSIGYLDKSGEIVYTKDYPREYNFEFEECKTCSIYPLCGNMLCPDHSTKFPNDKVKCFRNKGGYLGRFLKRNVKNFGGIEEYGKKVERVIIL